MPTRTTKGSRKPQRRGRSARRPAARRVSLRPRVPVLDQRGYDVIGLALIAGGVFLALVLYDGVDGGRAGRALQTALSWLLGVMRFGAPLAVVGGGTLCVMRPTLPSLRPYRAGGACVFAGATLALAAGTLGLGPGHGATGATVVWDTQYLELRGGMLGEALYWVTFSVAGQLGSDIAAVFLVAAGLPLLTGASIASALRATGQGVARTSRRVAANTRALAPSPAATPVAVPRRRLAPPVPVPDFSELVVHATHAEAPSPAFPEVDVEEPEGPGVTRAEPQPEPEPATDRTPPRTYDESELTPQGRLRASVTDDPAFAWKLPSPSLLRRSSAEQARPDTDGQERVAQSLVEALGHFGVAATVVGTVAGPHITRYELRLAPGTKVSKVAQLKDDLAYALAATDIRILAPIPGKQAVGVEVPNERRRIVQLGDVFQDAPPDWSPLTVWLGKDVSGKAIAADLSKMPHLLVAGTTGAGKSGAVNAMLSSILLRADPHQVRLVLVDPKQVELNHYESIPHLLTPVITSPRMAANALGNLVREMEQRYGTMSLARTRSLPELNRVREGRGEPPLPYILCVIDELADLMMVAPADVEDSIIRLAQKARAVGIHLVLATQSPRVDVITGMIKANVPSRIAFAVSSQTDSRVILDQNGAESLLGQGDMLFAPVGSSRLQRIQGAYIDEPQIEALTDFWRRQGEPEFKQELLEDVVAPAAGDDGAADDGFDPDEDPLLEEAIVLVAEMGTASTSMLQRRLRLGYTRAGRLIDMLERRGVISGYEGSKPRQVLVSEADLPRVLASLAERGAGPVAAGVATSDPVDASGAGAVEPEPAVDARDAAAHPLA